MNVTAVAVEQNIPERTATLDVLRRLRGRATMADIVAATGLAQARAEAGLRSVLSTHRGHIEVGERGDLVYAFDPHLLTRDHVPFWRRLLNGVRRVAKTAFKAWIAVMLLAYFIIFLVLAVAAIVVVVAKRDDSDFDMRGGRHFSFNWLWFLFWTPDWRWGRPYYGQRWERRLAGKQRVPFYKKVFAFVLGPDEPAATREEQDRELVQLIRSRSGVITAADVVMLTGRPLAEVHEELGRLMGSFEGDARATERGEVVYVFPDLMVSAHGTVSAAPPDPAWRRLLQPRPLTGNSTGTNIAIGAINTFNLAGVAAAAYAIPAVAPGSTAVWGGLVWVPLVFSTLFFSVPLIRSIGTRRENERRRERNLRSVVLGIIMDASLQHHAISHDDVVARVQSALGAETAGNRIRAAMDHLAAELEADVVPGTDGSPGFAFNSLRREFEAGETLRRSLRYEQRQVGAVVYSSADDTQEEARRDLETFDRQLRATMAADRIAFSEPF